MTTVPHGSTPENGQDEQPATNGQATPESEVRADALIGSGESIRTRVLSWASGFKETLETQGDSQNAPEVIARELRQELAALRLIAAVADQQLAACLGE